LNLKKTGIFRSMGSLKTHAHRNLPVQEQINVHPFFGHCPGPGLRRRANKPLVRPDANGVRPDLTLVRPDEKRVRPDLTPVRPDEKRVRPDPTPVKPDEKRVRPDPTLVKPDEKRVRPDLTPVRPDATLIQPDAQRTRPAFRLFPFQLSPWCSLSPPTHGLQNGTHEDQILC
jgi:hypothetical protein